MQQFFIYFKITQITMYLLSTNDANKRSSYLTNVWRDLYFIPIPEKKKRKEKYSLHSNSFCLFSHAIVIKV